MKSAEAGDSDDRFSGLGSTAEKDVLLKSEMGTDAIVVIGVGPEDLSKLRLAQDHDMIQAFSPDRTDEPFEGPFFQGERGAVDQSRKPIAWILRVTTAP
jgi:hypothetical protein